ncbi:hypothetical protein HWV62_10244 [Athelia sp. TMB]|nr:hypothetical protein HWV62_28680 [Athelia sp. TMB]KAF7971513.1 hypothetical protein HWV62_20902 [Athelia sp. TMB]KAF7975188.1 hypothetical protein HWV62_10244 [Athelia sp. TMB]
MTFTFQGGFVGTRCSIQFREPSDDRNWQSWVHIYPEDVNRQQIFDLPEAPPADNGVETIKLVFEESSDFFGRITVYDMKIEGLAI